MLRDKVRQAMKTSGGFFDNLPHDIQGMVNMYMDWQRVTPHTHFHQLWNSYAANHNNPNVRAFFDGLADWRKESLLRGALYQGHPSGAESMPQANPYTVATDSLYDTVRKYKHALLNRDNVPAHWADIPEGPQKWKLEQLGKPGN